MTDVVVDLDVGSGSTRRWPIRVAVQLLTFSAVVGVWAAASDQGWVSERILPPPSGVVESWWNLASEGILLDHLGVTLWEVFAGFVLGAAGGFLIAVIASFWADFRQVVWPTWWRCRAPPLSPCPPALLPDHRAPCP